MKKIDTLSIEKIAMILHSTTGGVPPDASDEEQINCLGRIRDPWVNEAEWSRDDFRFQAIYVLDYLQEQGMLKL